MNCYRVDCDVFTIEIASQNEILVDLTSCGYGLENKFTQHSILVFTLVMLYNTSDF